VKIKLRSYYIKKELSSKDKKLKITYDKTSKDRPAWIRIKKLPERVRFVSIYLGKRGNEGRIIHFYRTYLIPRLFLPLDNTKEEMSKFYDEFSKDYNKSIKSTNYNIKAAEFLILRLNSLVS
jgi:hypothetical protein